MADAWIDVTPAGGYEWEGVPSGPALAAVIAGIDAGMLGVEARVSYLQACDRLVSWSQGQAGYALAAATHSVMRECGGEDDTGMVDSQAGSWAWDELAAALHVAPSTVGRRWRSAQVICESHRQLWQAVNDGHISWAQAVVIAEGVSNLTLDADTDAQGVMSEVISLVLPTAGAYPPARLRTRVEHLLMRAYPEIQVKHRKRQQRDDCGVGVEADAHGMAWLGVLGPAVDILAMQEIIDTRAQTLSTLHTTLTTPVEPPNPRSSTRAQSPDDPGVSADSDAVRTWGQWQIAAMLDALGLAPISLPPSPTDTHREDGSRAIPEVKVSVVVDLPTVLGLAEEPGYLLGFGPIDPDLARDLAASGDWQRWVRDPVAGYLLDEGSRRFPSARLARFIKARDARCDAPACGRTSTLDIDHTPTWASTRRTKADLLAAACARHNRSRERYGWNTPAPKTWTTPAGRTYRTLMHQVLPIPDTPPDDEVFPF